MAVGLSFVINLTDFDTTSDYTGKDVKPQIIENYDGSDIVLNEKENIILSPDYFEDLLLGLRLEVEESSLKQWPLEQKIVEPQIPPRGRL